MKIPKGYSDAVNRMTDNTMVKRKRTKGQTMIYKTLHRKLTIEQHETHKKHLYITQKPKDRAIRDRPKQRMNSGAPEGSAVPAPLVAPVVLLLNDTNII